MEDSYELSSCLQKAIRRCDKIGLYCVVRLDLMKLDVWRKLEVMAVEDIGRAYPLIVSYLKSQSDKWRKEKRADARRYIMSNTVNFLINQNKSRMADNICHAYFHDPPDVTLKCEEGFETALKNKDMDSAMRYAAHLYNDNRLDYIVDLLKDPQDDESRALIYYIDKWKKSGIQNGRTKLFLINLIQHRTMNMEEVPIVDRVDEISMFEIKKMYESKEIKALPDWTFDKHTIKGKKMGRGIKHFFESSAKLNQSYIDDPYEELAREKLME